MNLSTSLIVLLPVLLLLILTAIAAFSLYNIRSLSLPIPISTATATLLLPLFTSLTFSFPQKPQRLALPSSITLQKSTITSTTITATILLLIYATTLATLSLTHLLPLDALTCPLNEQWLRLYTSKNGPAVRRIQDAHQCCGLHSVRDKAWPFPDKTHGVDTCAKRFERNGACFGPWRKDQQVAAGLLLLVVLGTAAVKLAMLLLAPQTRTPWLQNLFHRLGRSDHSRTPNHDRAIDETPSTRTPRIEAYHDASDEDMDLASEERGAVVQPSGLRGGDNAWREE